MYKQYRRSLNASNQQQNEFQLDQYEDKQIQDEEEEKITCLTDTEIATICQEPDGETKVIKRTV